MIKTEMFSLINLLTEKLIVTFFCLKYITICMVKSKVNRTGKEFQYKVVHKIYVMCEPIG